MGRQIPGNPKIIVKNRPGAGSLLLANELYNTLPKDGTAIGMGLATAVKRALHCGSPQLRRLGCDAATWIRAL